MATIRQIEIFLHLAEVLHFNRAAEELNITQAALSKEISSLEKSLNCRLFDRSDRWAIKLTAAGAAYQACVAAIPGELAAAENAALRAARGETGQLAIAVANLVYDYVKLEGFFRAMHEKYPEVKIIIRDCQGSPMVYDQVRSGQADIGFLAINSNGNYAAELRKISLKELPLSLAFPPDHPLAGKKNLQIEDLANCNFILPPMGLAPWLRKNFEELFIQHCGKAPLVEQEALGLRATRQLVAAGLGIGVMIPPAEKTSTEKITYRPIPTDFRRIIVAAWDPANQSQILKNFVKLMPGKPIPGTAP